MPTSAGPNTLGESNLVFAYDTGDVKNSYKGQPTVNGVGTLNGYNPLDLYTWAPSGNTSTWARDTTVTSPLGGIPLKEISSGTDSYSDTYNNSNDNIIAASSGQTWTVSVYALAAEGTNLQVWIFGANSSGNYIELAANGFTATGQWQRISVTMTFSNGSTAYVQARVATSTNGGVIWWDGLQVEQKSYATQFTTGTRSATQGLLPLIGNSTLDLTNVSFDSNAKMVFDGTDDYIGFGNVSGNIGGKSQATMELILKVNALQSNDFQQVFGFRNGSDFDFFMIIYPSENSGGTEFRARNSAGTFYDLNPNISAYIGKYLHVVFSVGPAGRQVYFNNVLVASNATWTGNFGPTSYFSIGNYLIGMAWSLEGDIPVAKLYDKQLTAQEVKQNYQQYKTRFNLS